MELSLLLMRADCQVFISFFSLFLFSGIKLVGGNWLVFTWMRATAGRAIPAIGVAQRRERKKNIVNNLFLFYYESYKKINDER